MTLSIQSNFSFYSFIYVSFNDKNELNDIKRKTENYLYMRSFYKLYSIFGFFFLFKNWYRLTSNS